MLLRAGGAAAAQADFAAALREITGGVQPREGRVKVDAPPLAETGTAVPVTVSVDSAMTDEDRVAAIHILLEQNPEPDAAHFTLGPRAGKAEIATRVRMFAPQKVYGLAAMRDGSFWIGSVHVEVTLAACVEIDVR
jgi:sulfur-oxidizing protein SoxY